METRRTKVSARLVSLPFLPDRHPNHHHISAHLKPYSPLEEQPDSILPKFPTELNQQALLDTDPRLLLVSSDLSVEGFEEESVGGGFKHDGRVALNELESFVEVEVRDREEGESDGSGDGKFVVFGVRVWGSGGDLGCL